MGVLWRFFDRQQIKTIYATEQDRADVQACGEQWCNPLGHFDPQRLICIAERGVSTTMVRLRCSLRTMPSRMPHGHWKTTFTAEVRIDGLAAPMLLDGPTDETVLLAYVH